MPMWRHWIQFSQHTSLAVEQCKVQAAPSHPSCAAQGAIVTMTKCLAKELVKTRGIRVNAVAPGPVWTPLIAESFPAEKVCPSP